MKWYIKLKQIRVKHYEQCSVKTKFKPNFLELILRGVIVVKVQQIVILFYILFEFIKL